jgi:hypothetical protein
MVVTKTCSDSVENCSCELEIHVSILTDYSSYEYVFFVYTGRRSICITMSLSMHKYS